MKLNKKVSATTTTHEGGRAYAHLTIEQQLRRSVMACLLWEDSFYEDGEKIADRIARLADQASAELLSRIAIEARNDYKMRHAPLLLCSSLAAKGGRIVGQTIAEVIQRPDELAELLAIYWRNGKKPLSKQMKIGLGKAFQKFDEYQFGKYNRDGAIKLRDVLFLSHAKPENEEREALYKKIAENTLATPDTWEVGLSGGGDKREVFERLLLENKLGYLALLRNLRNMQDAGVDRKLIRTSIMARKGAHNVLPFRYLMAARMAPQFESELNDALLMAIEDASTFEGETLVLVDVSGSMRAPVSSKSKVIRSDAAAMLGALVKGDIRCFAFGTGVIEVPHRLGMAGVDAFQKVDVGYGTNIGLAVKTAERTYPNAKRIIVLTDEQSHDDVVNPSSEHAYMINVAAYENGVGYGRWKHVDGFSENTLRWIQEIENA